MKKKNVICLLLFSGLLFLNPLITHAQQWFVRNFDISSAITQKPDFRPGGTYVTANQFGTAKHVLVYGTVGYFEHELSGADGGHGNADVVVLCNDLDGNNLWALTVGTQNHDVVSRVVEDSQGSIIVTGYTVVDDQKEVFLIKLDKIDVDEFAVDWAHRYGPGVPTDMVNVNADLTFFNTVGYAVCGNSGSEAFLIYTDMNGSITSSGHWAHYYQSNGSLRFNSLVQLKSRNQSANPVPPYVYRNSFIVAGKNSGHGYVAKINWSNGNILNDLDFKDVDAEECGSTVPNEYVSIAQDRDDNLMLFGLAKVSAERIHLTKVSPAFTLIWDQAIFEGGGDKARRGYPLDVNVTAFGYLGIFEYDGASYRSFKTVEYDLNGNIIRYGDLVNTTGIGVNWYFSKEWSNPAQRDLLPYVDFEMECGKALHLTGTEGISPNPPSSWSVDNVPHARLRLNTESCMERSFTMSNTFCNAFDNQNSGLSASKGSPIADEEYDPQLEKITPQRNNYCQSDCPRSACVNAVVLDGQGASDIILEGDEGFSQYLWFNGATSPDIRVQITNNFNSYSVDQVDANGCITTKTIHVLSIISGKRNTADNLTAEEESAGVLSLYPNPSSGIVNVILPQAGISLEIFDATGKPVKHLENLPAGEHLMDLADQPNGLYFIRITDSTGIHRMMKIVKE